MKELPPDVVIVEIDDADYDWKPCRVCKLARWWWTVRNDRKCFQCNPPPGVAFRMLELLHRSEGAPKR